MRAEQKAFIILGAKRPNMLTSREREPSAISALCLEMPFCFLDGMAGVHFPKANGGSQACSLFYE